MKAEPTVIESRFSSKPLVTYQGHRKPDTHDRHWEKIWRLHNWSSQPGERVLLLTHSEGRALKVEIIPSRSRLLIMQCWACRILTEECLFEGLFGRRRWERGDWRGVWLQGQNLKVAAAEGHLVGLHSHSPGLPWPRPSSCNICSVIVCWWVRGWYKCWYCKITRFHRLQIYEKPDCLCWIWLKLTNIQYIANILANYHMVDKLIKY